MFNNPMVKGILIGVGASVLGFCAYKHNEEKVDDFLRRHGLRTRLRRKLCEGSSEIIDSLRQGHVSYIINTLDLDQHNTRFDGYEIRRTAVENNVTLFTSLETVKVLLDVLEEITLSVSTIDAK